MIYKIPVTESVVDGSAMEPGSTILMRGNYPKTPYFKNLFKVKITNDGPTTLLSSLKAVDSTEWGLVGNKKDPFKITAPQIDTKGNKSSGVTIYGRSSDFEIAYMIIEDCSFAGIMAKDDGLKRGGDFVMQNLKLHHNQISRTGGEPFYIGQTKPTGHDLKNVEINNNIIRKAGWDAIQIANCVSGMLIHHNDIDETGLNIHKPEEEVQDNGIQIGERTKGKVYQNELRGVRGQGIICIGTGVEISLNQIYSPGESGIYCDDRGDTVEGFRLIENLIVSPVAHCIALHANKGLVNFVENNILMNPGSFKMLQNTKRSPFIEKDELVQSVERNNYMEDEGSYWRNMKLSDYYRNR